MLTPAPSSAEGESTLPELGGTDILGEISAVLRESLLLLDSELRIRWANQAFLSHFTLSADSGGLPFFEVNNGEWNVPEMHQILEEIIPRHGSVQDFEVTRHFPGLERRTLRINGRKLRQPAGFILLAVEDVTVRNEVERALREHEARFRLIFDSVQDFAIFSTDLAGNITAWNSGAEHVFGYSEAEAVGQNFAMIYTPEDRELHIYEEELRQAKEKGGALNERWHLRKDGTRFFASGMVRPLLDDDGQICGFIKVARDTTARKQLEEALQAANARRNDFIATLGHELRNPIAAIQNAIQLAQGPNGAAHLEWSLRVIARQSRQVSRLLEDMLDVTRGSQGMLKLRKEPLELGRILHAAADVVRPSLETRQHELLFSLPKEPLHIEADPARLEQVFVNLLSNAIKYTEPGGRIILRAWAQDAEVMVEVEDNGMGIEPDAMPHIFEMYAQGAREKAQGGLGIGLPLVRQLVEMHGGRISAFSRGVGAGSVFRVQLPVGRKTSDHIFTQAVSPAKQRSLRVLVVDDNADSATGMSKLLRAKGHEVEVANDGESALDVAGGFHPELILCDLGLPDTSGYELARRFRTLECCHRSLMVAITGFASDADQHEAKEAGFDHYLIKPVDMDVVFQLIQGMHQ